MSAIHSTAIVSQKAELGNHVSIGPFSIIEEDVIIGDDTQIASHVLVASGARIGTGCKIHQGAVLSTAPQDLKFGNEKTYLEVGDRTTIREYATLNRATSHSYYTRVGKDCFLMAYSHVAHDCQLGNSVILANAVALAGHVIIEDFVTLGGLSVVHQFVRIGTYAFIGGAQKVKNDIPPYSLIMGDPTTFAGLNKVGLTRRGFSQETMLNLRRAYKILYRENNTLKETISILEEKYPDVPEVVKIVEFLKKSERGIIR